jgi:ABC-type amino acid transport substrate-binding protein
MRRLLAIVLLLMCAGALTGCGLSIPADPDGTLDRVSDGVLRAGASPSDGLVDVDARTDAVSGPLADLVEGFARSRGARVEWTVASEEELVDELVAGRVDLAVGGMTDATPWGDRVSVTRGFPGIPGSGGRPVVLLLPLGENALQASLEAYLDGEPWRGGEAP